MKLNCVEILKLWAVFSLALMPMNAPLVAQSDTSSLESFNPTSNSGNSADSTTVENSGKTAELPQKELPEPKADNRKSGKLSDPVYTTVVMPGIYHGVYSKREAPILIRGNIVVPAGKVLEFGPGCVVHMAPQSMITVYGELRALGTREEPVRFISSLEDPSGGDWECVYIRSRSASLFRNTIIRHSRSGLTVENGSVSVEGCIFELNSQYAISLKGSEASVGNSVIRNGHFIGILAGHNAVLETENLTIRDNSSAILLSDLSKCSIRSGSISHNQKGIVASPRAVVALDNTIIEKNRTGILSAAEMPRRQRLFARNNADDFKKVDTDELLSLFASDSNVSSSLVSALSDPDSIFVIENPPVEEQTSFIGNVTAGFSYYRPRSYKHPVQNRNVTYTTVPVSEDSSRIDSAVVYSDTMIYQKRYPGEQSDRIYAGMQPELQVFASGKKGETDINLLMDIYGNQWLRQNGYIRKNMFNLSMDFEGKSLAFGDFYESGSEISMAGRQMTGVRFTGNFWDMGSGNGKVEVRLAAGETEVSQDAGDRSIDIYNEVVDSGMSVRQQITYVLSGLVRPSRNSHFSARGIISRDQIYKPLFGSPVEDEGAPKPLQAQTGLFEGGVKLLGGALELFAELDLGSHDTIPEDEWEMTAWYNPEIEEAVPKVFSLLNRRDFRSHSAVLGGLKGYYNDLKVQLAVMEISDQFFSAGNPYLENDKRRFTLGVEKTLFGKLDASTEYNYEKILLSEDPETRNTGKLSAAYAFGDYLPELRLDYLMQVRTSNESERIERENVYYDSAYKALDMQNLFSIEGRQTFKNGAAYSLRYQMLHDNDLAHHPDPQMNDLEDGIQHQLNGSLQLRYNSLLRNRFNFRFATKETNRDSLQGINYRIGNRLTYNVLPRKLTLSFAGDYSRRNEKEYDSERSAWENPMLTVAYGGESEVRYTINSQFTFSLKGRYEKSYDELPGSSENYSLIMGAFHVTCLF